MMPFMSCPRGSLAIPRTKHAAPILEYTLARTMTPRNTGNSQLTPNSAYERQAAKIYRINRGFLFGREDVDECLRPCFPGSEVVRG